MYCLMLVFGTLKGLLYTKYDIGIRFIYYASIANSEQFCLKFKFGLKNCFKITVFWRLYILMKHAISE
ncbi:hypothetical protein CLV32_2193 [Pedobacter duraquae]|uniref:Uncharacterized protein n=1 Tax=Pedobacter duraquae TaxID=425511 RepID=A0A4R6IM16_9SPHI|nr:hypothetical protein CLV32_2193 [Pedobacter duraquae]